VADHHDGAVMSASSSWWDSAPADDNDACSCHCDECCDCYADDDDDQVPAEAFETPCPHERPVTGILCPQCELEVYRLDTLYQLT
jgi:hypothetical protein